MKLLGVIKIARGAGLAAGAMANLFNVDAIPSRAGCDPTLRIPFRRQRTYQYDSRIEISRGRLNQYRGGAYQHSHGRSFFFPVALMNQRSSVNPGNSKLEKYPRDFFAS